MIYPVNVSSSLTRGLAVAVVDSSKLALKLLLVLVTIESIPFLLLDLDRDGAVKLGILPRVGVRLCFVVSDELDPPPVKKLEIILTGEGAR
jgi:hypothetical protein